MIEVLKIYLLGVCVICSTVVHGAEITESDVNNLISSSDRAINYLDANALSKIISNNAEIIINIEANGKVSTVKLTKNKYIDSLKQGWSTYKDYRFSKSDVNITIKNNTAFVTSDVKEIMTVNGNTIVGKSKEEVTLELVDGILLITKIVGDTSM